ncbi:hypothetical protein [Algisphaera agarilytica]|uniref:Uncharacterized protein n=1 Tax=Algisphaera agarilytica TaxID=1385975 RepID=A0A7X0H6N2_9BACT|nr:hypothetical protein [Algisphaera agarilytica]MBB6430219.1 hypothetical protein [Algisphaera agarilytica]
MPPSEPDFELEEIGRLQIRNRVIFYLSGFVFCATLITIFTPKVLHGWQGAFFLFMAPCSFPLLILSGLVLGGSLRNKRYLTTQLKLCRNQRGLCFKCGYNLTGGVSKTCPECGCWLGQSSK